MRCPSCRRGELIQIPLDMGYRKDSFGVRFYGLTRHFLLACDKCVFAKRCFLNGNRNGRAGHTLKDLQILGLER